MARICTTCRSKPGRSPATCPLRWGVAWPIRFKPVRRLSRGAKLRAAGIARGAFPWRQAKCAAPQARRREGLKPNGRDGKDGTGHSPKARRRIAPTRSPPAFFTTCAGLRRRSSRPKKTRCRQSRHQSDHYQCFQVRCLEEYSERSWQCPSRAQCYQQRH